MTDGKRHTAEEEKRAVIVTISWIVTICTKHGKMFAGGTWLHLPNLVAFLASDKKDTNTVVYNEKCDECCKCGKDCTCHK